MASRTRFGSAQTGRAEKGAPHTKMFKPLLGKTMEVYIDDMLVKTKQRPDHVMSRPDSRFDPIGGSKPVSGCEILYWDSLPPFFFQS